MTVEEKIDRILLIESMALAMVHRRERNYRFLSTWDEVAFEIGPVAAADWLELAETAVRMVEENARKQQ